MVDFNALREKINKQLNKCDPFFRKPENKALVLFYVYYYCQKHLGKINYDCDVTPTPKGGINIDIVSARKRVNPLVITKQKIKRHAKEYELFD